MVRNQVVFYSAGLGDQAVPGIAKRRNTAAVLSLRIVSATITSPVRINGNTEPRASPLETLKESHLWLIDMTCPEALSRVNAV